MKPLDRQILESLSDLPDTVDEDSLPGYTPSPREIQRMQFELQAGWSEKKRKARMVIQEEPVDTAVVVMPHVSELRSKKIRNQRI